MFDDQNTNQTGSVPGNLPIGEPEDIFAGAEEPGGAVPPFAQSPPQPMAASIETAPMDQPMVAARPPVRPSAVDAGVLRPKNSVEPEPFIPEASEVPPASPAGGQLSGQPAPSLPNQMMPGVNEMYTIQKPFLGRGIVVVMVVIVGMIIIVGGGWWIYSSFIDSGNNQDIFSTSTETPDTSNNEENQAGESGGEEATGKATDVSEQTVDSALLFGEPLDKDEDQLDDELEKTVGTDPENWDTDGDGLSDGEEIIIWESDPLDPDTDGDSYLDGAEVDSGYSPTEVGVKLNIIPTST